MATYSLHQGDCREVMRTLPESSVDAIVTDPPYELGFMGKGWDATGVANDRATWAACLHAAKPGAWLLAFGGTRTFHRIACAIEDAGWELRDTPVRGHMHQPDDCPWLMGWMYGSGFPKSHNGEWGGTALKPAWEPIVCARKPLIGTVAENFAAHGTGALNIDACRIPTDEALRVGAGTTWDAFHRNEGREGEPSAQRRYQSNGGTDFAMTPGPRGGSAAGRWPANLMHDGSDEVSAMFPQTTSGAGAVKRASSADGHGNAGAAFGAESRAAGTPMVSYGDTGSAARFFYCAKASREDRNEGLEGFAKQSKAHLASKDGGGGGWAKHADKNPNLPRANIHPTVKPTELMRYLCRLVTPRGGMVLDPFAGSGSTGKAAVLEGFQFTGIELDPEYIAIARARIDHAKRMGHQPGLMEAA